MAFPPSAWPLWWVGRQGWGGSQGCISKEKRIALSGKLLSFATLSLPFNLLIIKYFKVHLGKLHIALCSFQNQETEFSYMGTVAGMRKCLQFQGAKLTQVPLPCSERARGPSSQVWISSSGTGCLFPPAEPEPELLSWGLSMNSPLWDPWKSTQVSTQLGDPLHRQGLVGRDPDRGICCSYHILCHSEPAILSEHWDVLQKVQKKPQPGENTLVGCHAVFQSVC